MLQQILLYPSLYQRCTNNCNHNCLLKYYSDWTNALCDWGQDGCLLMTATRQSRTVRYIEQTVPARLRLSPHNQLTRSSQGRCQRTADPSITLLFTLPADVSVRLSSTSAIARQELIFTTELLDESLEFLFSFCSLSLERTVSWVRLTFLRSSLALSFFPPADWKLFTNGGFVCFFIHLTAAGNASFFIEFDSISLIRVFNFKIQVQSYSLYLLL